MSRFRQCSAIALFLAICVYQAMPTNGISFDEYVTLSPDEKRVLFKFKTLVEPKLTDDFMKTDIYLIRWLRNAKFDIQRAEKALFNYVRRRKEIGLDTIHKEDWSDFRKDYPYWVEGEDKEGRPLLLLPFEEWDIRKAVLSGNSKKLIRLFEKAMDEAMLKVREMQDQGKNITQYCFVQNLGKFNTIQHMNPTTLPFWLAATNSYESDSSGMTDKILLVDSNRIYNLVLQLVGPLMTSQTRNAIVPITKTEHDRLFDYVDQKYLPVSYGGTKVLH